MCFIVYTPFCLLSDFPSIFLKKKKKKCRWLARLRAAVATPLQCPVGALTLGAAPGAFQGVHAGERLLAHARVSLHPVQIFRLLLKISVEGNASELKVFLEALLRRSCVFLSKVKRLFSFSRFTTSAPSKPASAYVCTFLCSYVLLYFIFCFEGSFLSEKSVCTP